MCLLFLKSPISHTHSLIQSVPLWLFHQHNNHSETLTKLRWLGGDAEPSSYFACWFLFVCLFFHLSHFLLLLRFVILFFVVDLLLLRFVILFFVVVLLLFRFVILFFVVLLFRFVISLIYVRSLFSWNFFAGYLLLLLVLFSADLFSNLEETLLESTTFLSLHSWSH